MLVITMETGSLPGGRTRWAGRRHDDDRLDATSGVSSAELFDAVFHALHDGEQVALGLDCALTMPVPPEQGRASAPADADALVTLAGPAASQPGHRLEQSGPRRRELGQHQGAKLDRWELNRECLGLRWRNEDKHRGTP